LEGLKTRTGRVQEAQSAEVLVFMIGEVRCAIPLGDVREVVRAVALTPLPTAPSIVEGVIDVRGRLVPVLDLRGRLGLPAEPNRADQKLVIADAGDRRVAVRVDSVDWVTHLDERDVAEPDHVVRGIGYLAGVGRLPDGLVLVHDLATFLEQGEAEALAAALDAYLDGEAGRP
jgi:purine-binding chemotaxis protein CheW